MTYNQKVIDFFKRHNMYDEEMFEYLQKNSTIIDYKDPEQRCFIGCFYVTDRYDILKILKLNLPYIENDETMLINIHEITHGIENYQKIGKKFQKDITIEALPLLYEKIYIIENPNGNIKRYGQYLDSLITKESEKEYQFALKIREELLKNYHYNMPKMQKLTKKLSKRIHI